MKRRGGDGKVMAQPQQGALSCHDARTQQVQDSAAPAAGHRQPRHLTPCACHCTACRAAGHGNGACVVLRMGLLRLFHGKADIVDLVLWHYHGASGWGTARLHEVVDCVQYGPAGDVIAAACFDGSIRLICAHTGEKMCRLRGHTDIVASVCFSPDGTKIVSGSHDKTVRIWDVASWEQFGCSLDVGSAVISVQFSPSGDTIATGCWDGTVSIIGVATAEVKYYILSFGLGLLSPFTHTISCHSDWVYSVSWSPDGKRLASGSRDKTVCIWEAATGKQLLQLNVDSAVLSVQFSPSGDIIAAGCRNGTVQLIDVATAEVAMTGHVACRWDYVRSVSWSPDGTMLASGSDDSRVRIWEAATGKQLSLLTGHTDLVRSVCFSPDGTKIVSGSEDKTVLIWDAALRGEVVSSALRVSENLQVSRSLS